MSYYIPYTSLPYKKTFHIIAWKYSKHIKQIIWKLSETFFLSLKFRLSRFHCDLHFQKQVLFFNVELKPEFSKTLFENKEMHSYSFFFIFLQNLDSIVKFWYESLSKLSVIKIFHRLSYIHLDIYIKRHWLYFGVYCSARGAAV